jgi:hypothetical protein
MKLPLDANILLEILLKQPRAAEARALLESDEHEFYLSLFSVYSLGILLDRRKRERQWAYLLKDLIQTGYVKVLALAVEDLSEIFVTARRLLLDFDDSYQYRLAEIHDLTFVSFDKGFDRTPRGRCTPQAILQLTNNAKPNLKES